MSSFSISPNQPLESPCLALSSQRIRLWILPILLQFASTRGTAFTCEPLPASGECGQKKPNPSSESGFGGSCNLRRWSLQSPNERDQAQEDDDADEAKDDAEHHIAPDHHHAHSRAQEQRACNADQSCGDGFSG